MLPLVDGDRHRNVGHAAQELQHIRVKFGSLSVIVKNGKRALPADNFFPMQNHGSALPVRKMPVFEIGQARLENGFVSFLLGNDACQAQVADVIIRGRPSEIGVANFIYEKATGHGKEHTVRRSI